MHAGAERTFRPKAQWVALQAARQRQQTKDFRAQYALRSGSESAILQATRDFDLRRTRYIGLAKTSLQHILIAVSINLSRFLVWLLQKPMTRLRMTPFGSLATMECQPVQGISAMSFRVVL
jgi:transposase